MLFLYDLIVSQSKRRGRDAQEGTLFCHWFCSRQTTASVHVYWCHSVDLSDLTSIKNLIIYILINLIQSFISWKLGSSLVPGGGAFLGARKDLSNAQTAMRAWGKCHGKCEERDCHPLHCWGGKHGQGPAAGVGSAGPAVPSALRGDPWCSRAGCSSRTSGSEGLCCLHDVGGRVGTETSGENSSRLSCALGWDAN